MHIHNGDSLTPNTWQSDFLGVLFIGYFCTRHILLYIYRTKSYLLSVTTASMLFISFSTVICWWSSPMAIPFATQLATFDCWSPNTGIPIIGTPKWTASMTPIRPPCVMNALTFLWPVKARSLDCINYV